MKFRFAAAAVLGLTAFGLSFSALRAQATKSVWDGVYSDAQARDGAELYGQQCASCHGDTLAGGEEAPPLAGGDFLSNWNGLTAGDLFERIRTTMPLSKPQSLSREVNAKILAYIFSVNKFPAGKTDMPMQTEILKGITIQASKP
jgi:S-disulfanyl-L-cysteine oxidoreductase SoxD